VKFRGKDRLNEYPYPGGKDLGSRQYSKRRAKEERLKSGSWEGGL